MNVFWLDKPLSVPACALFQEVLKAHAASACRDNVSAQAITLAAVGSNDYAKAIAAALMTIGGMHAPLVETMRLLRLEHPAVRAEEILRNGQRVPGWGNSFHKNEPDPRWLDVDTCLTERFPVIAGRLSAVTMTLHRAGRHLYPNPSAYTAACAIALRMPRRVVPYLFIAGRLEGWSHLILNHTK